jgi:Na+/H+ antiporter NhaD/arsenite permease-like protein
LNGPPDKSGRSERDGVGDGDGVPQDSASVAFMITNPQKTRLRRLGYSDDAIAGMKPEEAHKILSHDRNVPRGARDGILGVLPLVAGLFVLVEGLIRTGVVADLADMLRRAADTSPSGAALGAGFVIAIARNPINNLPVGLVAGSVIAIGQFPAQVTAAMAIGVNLGPNLSITGSLATILWLVALRREGEHVSAWGFLRLGVMVAPPAIILAIGMAIWMATFQ